MAIEKQKSQPTVKNTGSVRVAPKETASSSVSTQKAKSVPKVKFRTPTGSEKIEKRRKQRDAVKRQGSVRKPAVKAPVVVKEAKGSGNASADVRSVVSSSLKPGAASVPGTVGRPGNAPVPVRHPVRPAPLSVQRPMPGYVKLPGNIPDKGVSVHMTPWKVVSWLFRRSPAGVALAVLNPNTGRPDPVEMISQEEWDRILKADAAYQGALASEVKVLPGGFEFVPGRVDMPVLVPPVVLVPEEALEMVSKVGTKTAGEFGRIVAEETEVMPGVMYDQGAFRGLVKMPDPETTVTVDVSPGRVRVRVAERPMPSGKKASGGQRLRPARTRQVSRAKKDQKSGSKWYSRFIRLINRTWGTWTEVLDFWDAFAWNVYDQEGRYAMAVTGGDPAAILNGIASGRFRLDFQEFVYDWAVNQLGDSLIAAQNRYVNKSLQGVGLTSVTMGSTFSRAQRFARDVQEGQLPDFEAAQSEVASWFK